MISKTLIALVLAIWLPFQGVAAMLVPCVLNDQGGLPELSLGSVSASDNTLKTAIATDDTADCHGAATATRVTSDDSSTANNSHKTFCIHCDGLCQSMQSFYLPSALTQAPPAVDPVITQHNPAIQLGFLTHPHRPPIYS